MVLLLIATVRPMRVPVVGLVLLGLLVVPTRAAAATNCGDGPNDRPVRWTDVRASFNNCFLARHVAGRVALRETRGGCISFNYRGFLFTEGCRVTALGQRWTCRSKRAGGGSMRINCTRRNGTVGFTLS